MAYFPAISLSFKESVAFNFGSRPLRYPLGVKGEEPVLRPSLEAVEYTYLTAVHSLLLALVCRAGSRREEPDTLLAGVELQGTQTSVLVPDSF